MSRLRNRKAENISYKDFLTSYDSEVCSPRLIIGNFQRNYVWTKKHIEALIDSIQNADKGYYLGNVVIQQGEGGSTARDTIVDGQQRLISLSLILLALRFEFKEQEVKDEINRLLFESPNSKEGRILFWRTSLRKTYKKLIAGNLDVQKFVGDATEKRLLKQYDFIQKKVRDLPDQNDFFKKLVCVEFVVIKCPSLHDMNQLYEGLNSKGKRLTPVEQTKNLLFGSLKDVPSQAKKIERIWENIESIFEKKKSVWFDKFLRHQFFSLEGYVSNADLFEKIKGHLNSNKNEVVNYSFSLKTDAEYYIFLREGEFRKKDFHSFSGVANDAVSDINYLLRCLKYLNLDQVYSLLLSLVKFADKSRSYGSNTFFLEDLEKIVSFFVLAKYSDISPSGYETILANFCSNLHNKQKAWEKKKAGDFSRIKESELFDKLFTKVEERRPVFARNFGSHVRYSTTEGVRSDDGQYIRMILNIFLTDEGFLVPEKQSTIEHIIPQGSLRYWKKIKQKFKDEIENSERYKLGNLTLIIKSKKFVHLNKDIGNREFDFKYENAYKELTGYVKNADLLKYRSGFNSKNPATAVSKRSEEIAGELYDKLLGNLSEK